jgi:hypothetical protein
VRGEDTRQLLHNMSAPPKTVVKYGGLEGLAKQSGPGGSGVTGLKYTNPIVNGVAVRFVLPPKFIGQDSKTILSFLKIEPFDQFASSDSQLFALINHRADELPLPEGCAVMAAHDSHGVIWPDALSALAILTKCTDTIWLRSKTPSLASVNGKSILSLLVPPLFTKQLPKVKK